MNARTVLFAIAVLCVASLLPQYSFQYQSDEQAIFEHMDSTTAIPININGNSELDALGLQGNGTQEDPYILENIEIATDEGDCIRIENIDRFLVIRNCSLSTTGSAYATCIVLIDLKNVNISNCYLADGYHGIYSDGISHCSFLDNQIVAIESNGFDIYRSHHLHFENNNLVNSTQAVSIVLFSCQESLVYNNSFNEIHVKESSNVSTLHNNVFTLYHDVGIPIMSDGIFYWGSESSLICNNSIDSIKGLGIHVYNGSSHIIIKNNSITECDEGIVVSTECENIIVENNYIFDIVDNDGIRVGQSKNVQLLSNTIYSGINGIEIIQTEDVKIWNNTISTSYCDAIRVDASTGIDVVSNAIHDISDFGIHVESRPNQFTFQDTKGGHIRIVGNIIRTIGISGIDLAGENNSYIEYNSIDDCGQSGIRMYSCTFGILKGNHISNCTEYGLYMGYSSHISIFENAFISANDRLVKVYRSDDALWSNNSRGNYYGDHPITDDDNDGIADSSYAISFDYTDSYPLAKIPEIGKSNGPYVGCFFDFIESPQIDTVDVLVIPFGLSPNADVILSFSINQGNSWENKTVTTSTDIWSVRLTDLQQNVEVICKIFALDPLSGWMRSASYSFIIISNGTNSQADEFPVPLDIPTIVTIAGFAVIVGGIATICRFARKSRNQARWEQYMDGL
ncbi:MAG: hypothetical protein GF411_19870 [Candidatus Lokiarchaeota archaeon]|nr:hypothetical protein [Candidatus Lokiarchaeota archaeon]